MIPTYLVNSNVGAAFLPIGYLLGMEDFGARLREARKSKGMTQKAVAAHFGIARVSVTQWESQTTRPDPARFVEIAKLYGVDLDWLMNGSGTGPSTSPPTSADIADSERLRRDIMDLSPEDRAYIQGRIDERLGRSPSNR